MSRVARRTSRTVQAYQSIFWVDGSTQRRTITVEYQCQHFDYACLRSEPEVTRALSRVGSCRSEATKAGSRKHSDTVRVYELCFEGSQRWFHESLVVVPSSVRAPSPSPVVDHSPSPVVDSAPSPSPSVDAMPASPRRLQIDFLLSPQQQQQQQQPAQQAAPQQDELLSPSAVVAPSPEAATAEQMRSAAAIGYAIGRRETNVALSAPHVRAVFPSPEGLARATWVLSTSATAEDAVAGLEAELWARDARLARALRKGYAHGSLESAWRERRAADVSASLARMVAAEAQGSEYAWALRSFAGSWERFYCLRDVSSINTLKELLLGSLRDN
eukprot:m51a1_g4519 hypothetical protein (330) ;mRNA; r:427544-428831